jgi:pimeloyl-ACP methyl ester carboxylesterase
VLTITLVVLLVALAAGFITSTALSAMEARKYRPRGSLVSVGDRQLHIDCRGSGAPAVVFESGFGDSSLDWALVQPVIGRRTRVCSYDRAGYGWSDPAQQHDFGRLRGDFEAMLRAGGVTSPFVLVAHSFGGMVALDYASRPPDMVAGLVLVDAADKTMYESAFRRFPQYATNINRLATVVQLGGILTWFGLTRLADQPAAPDTMASEVRGEYRARGFRPSSYRAFADDSRALRRYVAAAENDPLRAIPCYVLTHADPGKMWTGLPKAEAEDMWQASQRRLAHTFDASHDIVPGTTHFIQVRKPAAVIRAIDSVLAEVEATQTD